MKKIDLAPIKAFFSKNFSLDKIKSFAQTHSKKLAIAGIAIAAIAVIAIIIAILPGRREAHTFRAADEEYLVVMTFSSDWDIASTETATLTRHKSDDKLTSNFLEEKRSFCFLTEELGVYDFTYIAPDGATVTRHISIDEDNHLYFVYIFPEE